MLQPLDILTDKPHRAHTFSGLFLTQSLEMIQKNVDKSTLTSAYTQQALYHRHQDRSSQVPDQHNH